MRSEIFCENRATGEQVDNICASEQTLSAVQSETERKNTDKWQKSENESEKEKCKSKQTLTNINSEDSQIGTFNANAQHDQHDYNRAAKTKNSEQWPQDISNAN